MKRWCLGVVLLIAAIVSVAYEQHNAREEDRRASKEGCLSLAVSTEERHACEQQAQSRQDYSPWWHVLVTWPEGIGAWALLLTLGAISWQAFETRKAAEAAKASAIAALEQTKLQTAMMRQWIEVSLLRLEDQGKRQNPAGEYLPSPSIRIWIEAKNTSSHGLTVQVITALITIADTGKEICFECREAMPLSPARCKGDSYTFPIPLHLTDQMFDDYRTNCLILPIIGAIHFDPIAGRPAPQTYALTILCGNRSAKELPLAAGMRRIDPM